MNINEAINFPGVNEPVEFEVESVGDWSFGAIFVTNLETGRCYYCVEPGSGHKVSKGKYKTLLTEIKAISDTAPYQFPTYQLDFGRYDGTSDDTWCKVIDTQGK